MKVFSRLKYKGYRAKVIFLARYRAFRYGRWLREVKNELVEDIAEFCQKPREEVLMRIKGKGNEELTHVNCEPRRRQTNFIARPICSFTPRPCCLPIPLPRD